MKFLTLTLLLSATPAFAIGNNYRCTVSQDQNGDPGVNLVAQYSDQEDWAQATSLEGGKKQAVLMIYPTGHMEAAVLKIREIGDAKAPYVTAASFAVPTLPGYFAFGGVSNDVGGPFFANCHQE